jgi:pimeloyl-ACP methyl ester carboxylesterase
MWFRGAISDRGIDHRLVVQGCPIAYRTWGDGDNLVVLVHGRSANSHWWDHVAPFLAADRRVVAVDLSGHGDSGRRDRYDLDIWVREVHQVVALERSRISAPRARSSPATEIRENESGSTVVVGHSMGSTVGLALAAEGSADLSAVVAIDSPVGIPPRSGTTSVPQEMRYPTRCQVEARFRLRPASRSTPDFIVCHLARHAVRQLDSGEWTWKTDPRAMTPNFVEPADLGSIPVPTLLIRAERGIATDASTALLGELVSASIEVMTIPDAGHHVLIDQPRRLVSVLASYLDRLSG